METFEVQGEDGSIYEIQAPTLDAALQAFSGASGMSMDDMPKPPPGVIIHDRDKSYVAGESGLSVDTKNMSPEQRNLAAGALATRRDIPAGGVMQALSPVMQGVSASWGDEAVSAARAGRRTKLNGDDYSAAYDYYQEIQRQQLEQARKDAPITSAVSQIGGALTQAPLFAGPLAAAAGLPLAGRMAIGSGSGAVDRSEKSAWGAGIGGLVGGLAPAAGEYIGRAARNVMDRFTVDKQLGKAGLSRPAGDALTRALDADDAFSGQGLKSIIAAGDDAMLVDAGPTARAVLDTAMQRGGPATRIARNAVEQRAIDANTAITKTLDNVLGPPEGVAATQAAIRQGTQGARSNAYGSAYNAPIDYSIGLGRRLESMLKRVPNGAIAKANELMQMEGLQSRQILADIADNGTVTFKTLPDVRQWDYITRGLNAVAQGSDGSGALGGKTPIGSAAERLSGEIRKTVKKLVPEYGVALDTAADPIRRIQAVELGRDLLSKRIPRDEAAMQLKNMSAAELAAVRQGLRSHIDDTLASVNAVASDPNTEAREAMAAMKAMTSRATFDKFQMVLGPKETRAMFTDLNKAFKALELRAATTRNSATFGRGAVADAIKQQQTPGVIGNLMEAAPLKATKRLVQELTGRTPERSLMQEDQLYRELAETLTGKRGNDAIAAMEALTDAYQRAPVNADRAKFLGANAGAGIGLLGHQSTRQWLDR